MYKWFTLFSLLLSCYLAFSPVQTYTQDKSYLTITIESVELNCPDINDDHQAVLPCLIDFVPDMPLFVADSVISSSSFVQQSQAYSIRAPPQFS